MCIRDRVYLVVTALLILLVNTLRGARAQELENAVQWRGRFDLALAGSHQLMYRYNPFDGSLELAGDLQGAFGMQADAIPTLDALLALAHPCLLYTSPAPSAPSSAESPRPAPASRPAACTGPARHWP